MVTALRAAWLRYRIARQEKRRTAAERDARYHRDRARDAKAKGQDAQMRIDDDARALLGIERRRTVARLARATV